MFILNFTLIHVWSNLKLLLKSCFKVLLAKMDYTPLDFSRLWLLHLLGIIHLLFIHSLATILIPTVLLLVPIKWPSLYEQWHKRLGHPHHEVLKSIILKCNLHILQQSKFEFCVTCCLDKVHRLPSIASTTNYHEPFDLIFAMFGGLHLCCLLLVLNICLLVLMHTPSSPGFFCSN